MKRLLPVLVLSCLLGNEVTAAPPATNAPASPPARTNAPPAITNLPPSCEVHLSMSNAVFQHLDGPLMQLDLVATCRDGKWDRDVYGVALDFGRSEHFGRIQSVKTQGDRTTMDICLTIDSDRPGQGGRADYSLEFAPRDAKVSGKYKGTFRKKPLEGRVWGNTAPLLKPYDGFIPPEPGEHPRLLFRKTDLPTLRAKLQTDWGRKVAEKLKSLRREGEDIVAMGLMYQLTGEKKYMAACAALIDAEMADKSAGASTLGRRHGERQYWIAAGIDLIWDAAPERLRSKVAGYLWSATARTALRQSHLPTNVRILPGSSYLTPVLCGAYAAQSLLLDAPGAFPPPPGKPLMEKELPTGGFTPGIGVPQVTLASGQTIIDWLFCGPWFVYRDREDFLVLSGDRCEQFGQDFLAAIGGVDKAKVEKGAKVEYHGRACTFERLGSGAIVSRKDTKAISVWAAHTNVPCSTGFYFATLQNEKPGWYKVMLTPDDPAAGSENVNLGEEHSEFVEGMSFHVDADLRIGGRTFHDDDVVYLAAGVYPLVMRASATQYKAEVQPRLIETTEEAGKADLPKRDEVHQREMKLWKKYYDSCGFRPMYSICDRMARRYARWAQGDGGYNNETGPYYSEMLPLANRLGHIYRNMTGVSLPNQDMTLVLLTVTGNDSPQCFAPGFSFVRDEYKPAVLWYWRQIQRFDSDPIYTLVNYPLTAPGTPSSVQPKHPDGIIPNPYADRQMGLYIFRTPWSAKEHVEARLFLKSFPPTGWSRSNAGSFSLNGLGHTWVETRTARESTRLAEESVIQFPDDPVDESLGGEAVVFEGKPGGASVVGANLNDVVCGAKPDPDARPDAQGQRPRLPLRDQNGRLLRENFQDLGIRWSRWLGVDVSGTCGAQGLIVLVDQTKGGRKKFWQMVVPGGDFGPRTLIYENFFQIGHQDGASLKATFLSPTNVKISHSGSLIRAEGGDNFFVVMTLQHGKTPPQVRVEEGQGLEARAAVGKVKVSFDGSRILLGAPEER